jgi:uncharacterized protein
MRQENREDARRIQSAVDSFSATKSIPPWFKLWLKPDYSGMQYLVYVLGCVLFSFGANNFIASHLGTDPLDVFALGLMKHLPITVGIAQGGFAALMLTIWAYWNKRLPILSPFVTFFFCGTLIDIWMHLQAADILQLTPYPLMILGVFLCAFGSSLIIMSGIGIRPIDLLAITMMQKLRFPFWLAKGIIELGLLLTGWLLGGPIGVGTLAFFVFVGWMIQPIMLLNVKVLRLKNHGLSRT